MSVWFKNPQIEKDARRMKQVDNLSWGTIAEVLSNRYDIILTGNQVRKKINRKAQTGAYERVGVLSDLHVPFELPNILNIVETHLRGKVDTLVIAGDLFDTYALSVFPKRKNILMEEEISRSYEILEVLTSWFDNVILIKGNHDDRFGKHIVERISPTATFLVDLNIFNRFITGFTIPDYGIGNEGDKVYPPLKGLTVINEWWYKYNDVIFAHPLTFFKQEMKTVVETYNYFVSRGHQFKALLIGHTHKAGMIPKDESVVLIENGCLCKEMEYAISGNIKIRPQQRAITIMDFDNKSFVGARQILLNADGSVLTTTSI